MLIILFCCCILLASFPLLCAIPIGKDDSGALIADFLVFYGEGNLCLEVPSGFSLQLSLGMVGTWHKPLGISWLEITDVGATIKLSSTAAALQYGVPIEGIV
jgi:hypothetical protein